MSEKEDRLSSRYAWLNGRETWSGSLAYGEVVVPEINIWELTGSPPYRQKVLGRLPHGSKVSVLGWSENQEDKQVYYEVLAGNIHGWVSEISVAYEWSSFTFLGTLGPTRACSELDVNLEFNGMSLLVKKNGFAVVTEGASSDFECIRSAAETFVSRIANALAPMIKTSLKVEFSNWVEVPIDHESAQNSVGFMALEGEDPLSVSNEQIETAQTIVPLMSSIPYLDLALSDFSQALEYPQHSLIFLARAIESIENHCTKMAKHRKGMGKEKIMQELLEVKKSDVEYVTKRANNSHRRHASQDGTVAELSIDELAQCFHKTSNIIVAFVTFLRNSGL